MKDTQNALAFFVTLISLAKTNLWTLIPNNNEDLWALKHFFD